MRRFWLKLRIVFGRILVLCEIKTKMGETENNAFSFIIVEIYKSLPFYFSVKFLR